MQHPQTCIQIQCSTTERVLTGPSVRMWCLIDVSQHLTRIRQDRWIANLLICFYVNLQYVRSHAVTVAPSEDVDDWSFPRPHDCLAEAIKPASSSSGQVDRTPPKLSLISSSRYLWINFNFQYASIISPVSHLRITGDTGLLRSRLSFPAHPDTAWRILTPDPTKARKHKDQSGQAGLCRNRVGCHHNYQTETSAQGASLQPVNSIYL